MLDLISEFFEELEDPRRDQGKRHPREDLILIPIVAVICGADEWTEVSDVGRAKLKWFQTFLELPHGVASPETFGQVFAAIDPLVFERGLFSKIAHLVQVTDSELIAIDGQTLPHSYNRANNKAALHRGSAWCQANHLVLGQVATDQKSNEITAIPKLLELLSLKDTVVTIDAMGTQRAIAQQSLDQEGD